MHLFETAMLVATSAQMKHGNERHEITVLRSRRTMGPGTSAGREADQSLVEPHRYGSPRPRKFHESSYKSVI